MIDFALEFGEFIINLFSETPEFFKHVLSFLNDFVGNIGEVFSAGHIIVGILLVLILIKIVGNIRSAI